MVTIVLLVSRANYLEKVVTAIELLDCNPRDTNILCIVDGDDRLYIRTRNLIMATKFNQRLTVKLKHSTPFSNLQIANRRQHIAAAHNQARGLIAHKDGYVLSVEDDTIVPKSALHRLMDVAISNRAFAFAEGVELGRWGVPYVGAWTADDIYNPTKITSVQNIYPVPAGQRETNIDAGGLYCALMRVDVYKQHEFTCANGLGPDLNFGLEARQLGFENFIVWTVPCVHLCKKVEETSITPDQPSHQVTLTKKNDVKWLESY